MRQTSFPLRKLTFAPAGYWRILPPSSSATAFDPGVSAPAPSSPDDACHPVEPSSCPNDIHIDAPGCATTLQAPDRWAHRIDQVWKTPAGTAWGAFFFLHRNVFCREVSADNGRYLRRLQHPWGAAALKVGRGLRRDFAQGHLVHPASSRAGVNQAPQNAA